MLDAHRSQFYEWLPYNGGYADAVPTDPQERRAWLSERLQNLSARLSERCRDRSSTGMAPAAGNWPVLIEAFEASEYGAPFDETATARLFPFCETRHA
jgi:hypothetical protein